MLHLLPWGYRANIKLHASSNSVSLPLTASDETVAHRELVANLPCIKTRVIHLNPYLFNGTLQTIYYSKEFNKHQIYYGRQLVKFLNQGTASADFVIPPESDEVFAQKAKENTPANWPRMNRNTRFLSKDEVDTLYSSMDDKPIVVILHGLGGGSHEPLVRAVAERLSSTNGYDVVVLNSRGCSRTKITTPHLFHALSTGDIREFVASLKEMYPSKPVYAVGLSFGGGVLANFLGEEKESCLLDAACIISAPWDMVDSAHHITNSYSGKRMFLPAVASFLHRLILNNKHELMETAPDVFTPELLDRKYKSTIEFDSVFTAPLVGFQSAADYYRLGSPVNRILDIHTPTLILNSTDDPVVGVRLPVDDVKANPWLCMVETDLGGHLGFMMPGNESWMVGMISQYLGQFDSVDWAKGVTCDYKRLMAWKKYT